MQPSLFEIAFLSGRDTRFRVQFKSLRDAMLFADSFDGEAVGAHVAAA